ncbi:hypothetical protein GWI33_019135 [Rhynchophorus ferrugineus]|uniref:Uncharacterized protein n=1 Tax=Rhynchophorus ferrugineus TaxID=354439 RepID=A0A834M5K8_RHYFE|nr:hypothetical protein GWI33_019135 [Rhynchophorus ferrugineus]
MEPLGCNNHLMVLNAEPEFLSCRRHTVAIGQPQTRALRGHSLLIAPGPSTLVFSISLSHSPVFRSQTGERTLIPERGARRRGGNPGGGWNDVGSL